MDAEIALVHEDTQVLLRDLFPGDLAASDRTNWLALAKCSAHTWLHFEIISLKNKKQTMNWT
jgi:hypothetical protein